VYVSGQRSGRLELALGIVAVSLSSLRRAVMAILLMVILIPFLPQGFWTRMETVKSYVRTGQTTDTSTEERLERWETSWKMTLDNPFLGAGYGKALAHNAFLSISSTVGLIPACLLAGFVVALFMRLLRHLLGGGSGETAGAIALLLGLATVCL